MAQKTFADGDVLTASDINTYLAGEGGAWTSYTPTVNQGASTNIAKTTVYSKYARYGRTITWTFTLSMTAAGTAGARVTVTLPVTAAASNGVVGVGSVLDASTQNKYPCTIVDASTTSICFQYSTTATNTQWGESPSIALAASDVLQGSITYEAAS